MYWILIDEAMATAFDGGPIAWLKAETWRAKGIDPNLFPAGGIPMKRIQLENGVNNHYVAGKYYALAHRKGGVIGPPRWLISITFQPGDLLKCLFDGSVQINPATNMLAFKKQTAPENYPGITGITHPIAPEIGDLLLQSGCAALGNKRLQTSE